MPLIVWYDDQICSRASSSATDLVTSSCSISEPTKKHTSFSATVLPIGSWAHRSGSALFTHVPLPPSIVPYTYIPIAKHLAFETNLPLLVLSLFQLYYFSMEPLGAVRVFRFLPTFEHQVFVERQALMSFLLSYTLLSLSIFANATAHNSCLDAGG